MKIHNIDGLTEEEICREIDEGAKFVIFEYCISIIIMSFKNGGDIHFVRKNESTLKYSVAPSLVSLFLGWWGIPWGPIYTIQTIFRNLSGGKDVTFEELETSVLKNKN